MYVCFLFFFFQMRCSLVLYSFSDTGLLCSFLCLSVLINDLHKMAVCSMLTQCSLLCLLCAVEKQVCFSCHNHLHYLLPSKIKFGPKPCGGYLDTYWFLKEHGCPLHII